LNLLPRKSCVGLGSLGERPRPPALAEEGQCSPPSSHTRRMIGMGMPISHNSRPRAICTSFICRVSDKQTPVANN
jgi:hypothetical protein